LINNPPVPTRRVELALRAPLTERVELIVLEAVLKKPPVKLVRPKIPSVPLALTLPLESTVNLPLLKVVGV